MEANKEYKPFTGSELKILRRFYEIEKGMKRCGQTDEFVEKNYPKHLDLWLRFEARGYQDYLDRKCSSFNQCYERLLWPEEWIVKHEKLKTNNENGIHSGFQSLLRRIFKGQKVIILDDC